MSPATWPTLFPAPAALLAWLHELQASSAADKALHLAALRWLVLAELDRTRSTKPLSDAS